VPFLQGLLLAHALCTPLAANDPGDLPEAARAGLAADDPRHLPEAARAGLAADAQRKPAEVARAAAVKIVVRSAAPVDARELAALVALAPGEPLDPERVRATLRNLRLAGLASEVELWTRAVEGGVEVELVLFPEVVVGSVAIAGESGLPAARLLAAVPQKRGQPLREDRVVRGVYRIEELLAAEGFRTPRARVAVAPLEGGPAVSVTYRVEAGPRTRIGAVRLAGLAPPAEAAALEQLRARPGEPYRPAAVRDDRERLERWLARSGYRRAKVAAAEESAAGAAAVDLLWKIERGPRFELDLAGAERKTLEQRGLLSFLGDAPFDEALVLESVAAIRDDFQRRGHYRVEVRDELVVSGEVERLRLEIVPGPRFELAEVRFEGNDSFPAERLEKLLSTAPRRMLRPGSGRLVDSEVAEDLTNLRSFYALAGFDRARIGPARVDAVGANELAVVFPIEEGRRLTTGTLAVHGPVSVAPETLAAGLPLAPGGPFHRLLLDSAVDAVRARLEERGHRRALVEPRVAWDASGTVADVTLELLAGPRATVEAVVVRGNARTRTDLVRRFAALEPGEPIATGRLLDVQRRLYRLGLFARVDVSAPRAASTSEPSEVIVEVEEGRARSVAYGAGYDSESGVRGLFRFAHANLGGRALAFQLDALVSPKDELLRAVLRQPYLGRFPVELSVTAYDQREVRPDFEVDRRGGQLGAERWIGRTRLGLFAEYRLVELATGAPEAAIPKESRNARVASLTPTLLRDRRDDPVDPRRGWSATVQLERAFPFADADADYAKLFGQLSLYRPLGRGTLALSLRGGAIRPEATGSDPSVPAIDRVPAAELFYAGGRTTHRAFARDELGILGETIVLDEEGDPIARGGGALALANLEWRVPVAGEFGIALFLDGGNVWREAGDVDLSRARWGAGLGLRYASPVGPLRLEVGWKLDREPFEDAYEAFVSLGNAF
jgi:outer membrane protein insertion porin family